MRDPDLALRYRAALEGALPAELQRFVPFFGDLTRLETLAAMLDAHLDSGPGGRAERVLNLGCGPLAAELFIACLQGRDITAVDYTPDFVAAGQALQASGLLPRVTVQQGDVTAMHWDDASFDAIVIHDLLYEAALDANTLIPRLARSLRPGGLMYLDVMDSRVRGLWRLLGRERGYRRYHPRAVAAVLASSGLVPLERRPLRPRGGVLRVLPHVALRAFGLSNAVAIAARRDV